MTNLLDPHVSDREADLRAREWLGNLDHKAAVGSRHHIVPKFLLARFASHQGQLRVRRRSDGDASLRAIGDLGVRDFYTAVTSEAVLDSALESLLSMVEGGAAEILRQHLDLRTFVRQRPFTAEERAILDTFVAMQAIRGMRMRRTVEVIADYAVKLLNQDKLTEEEIETTDFVPHSNEHLQMLGTLADRVEEVLRTRFISIVRLDEPHLIISDEPVVVTKVDDVERKRSAPMGTVSGNYVLLEGGGGFANAETVMLAVSPSIVLVYGPQDVRMPIEIGLAGAHAKSFAGAHNQLAVQNAVDWVAANPDHATFHSMKMAPPLPLLMVHDNGSAAAARVNTTPGRRPKRRLRPDDVLDIKRPVD